VAGPGKLGVLLKPDQRQVRPDEGQHDAGEEQDMDAIQARDEDVTGEITTEQQPVQPRTDQWDAQGDRR
jgi:hypothetical protein